MQACVMSHAGLSSRLHQADASTSSARFGSRRFFSSAFLNPSSTQTTRVRPQSRFGERWRRTARGTTTTTRAGLQVDQEDMRIVDFYELMGVPDDADIKTIKRAYYDLAMYCHPDKSGDDGHDLCIMLNEAYAILKDPISRELYDSELAVQREDDQDEFTGVAYSKWTVKKAKPGETRAVFVDEFTCIGCKQCVWAAPATFRMDDDYGRSRVFAQWLNDEDDIECAIQSCPVDCIHWVQKEQLPYLEHVTRFMDKVSVGISQSGQGTQMINDPFDAAYAYEKMRKRKIERRRAQLEEERLNREWKAQQEAEAEAKAAKRNGETGEARAGAGAGAAGGGFGGDSGPSFRQRKAYRAAADKVKDLWSQSTGVKMDELKRRRWSDSGSTIPLERAIVPLGVSMDELDAAVASYDLEEEEAVPVSR